MVRNCTERMHCLGTSASDSLVACSCQKRLDRTLQQRQKIAAQMKREQKEMQEFSVLMKNMLHDNAQHTTRLQDKIAQVQVISSIANKHNMNFIVPKCSAAHKPMLPAGKQAD